MRRHAQGDCHIHLGRSTGHRASLHAATESGLNLHRTGPQTLTSILSMPASAGECRHNRVTIRDHRGSVLVCPPVQEACSPRVRLSRWQLLPAHQCGRASPKVASTYRESVSNPSQPIDSTCLSPRSSCEIARTGRPGRYAGAHRPIIRSRHPKAAQRPAEHPFARVPRYEPFIKDRVVDTHGAREGFLAPDGHFLDQPAVRSSANEAHHTLWDHPHRAPLAFYHGRPPLIRAVAYTEQGTNPLAMQYPSDLRFDRS